LIFVVKLRLLVALVEHIVVVRDLVSHALKALIIAYNVIARGLRATSHQLVSTAPSFVSLRKHVMVEPKFVVRSKPRSLHIAYDSSDLILYLGVISLLEFRTKLRAFHPFMRTLRALFVVSLFQKSSSFNSCLDTCRSEFAVLTTNLRLLGRSSHHILNLWILKSVVHTLVMGILHLTDRLLHLIELLLSSSSSSGILN
jgi:hypothetical protein